MKGLVRPPRFLPEVLQAIYELKETGGSTSNKIVTHVGSALRNSKKVASTPRNLSTQVRRALKHASTNGIVKQRAGKFRLDASFLDPYNGCEECRRRKRMSRRRRRRRRKRHSSLTPSMVSVSTGSESEELPVRELRRRRRRPSRRRRRRRRRMTQDKSRVERGDPGRNMAEELKNDMAYPDDHQENQPNDVPMDDDPRCDNPECLCNVKEEVEENQNFGSPM